MNIMFTLVVERKQLKPACNKKYYTKWWSPYGLRPLDRQSMDETGEIFICGIFGYVTNKDEGLGPILTAGAERLT
jgi:hypothetical protein